MQYNNCDQYLLYQNDLPCQIIKELLRPNNNNNIQLVTTNALPQYYNMRHESFCIIL